MDETLGLEWLKRCFEPFSRPSRADAYRLLLLDGHNSHVTADFIQFAIEKKIVLLCFPPHTTHLLQPLDVGVFSPYQHNYGRAVDNAVRGGLTGINKAIFLQLLKTAREETMKPRTIRSAFKSTGLIPFNPQRVLGALPNSTLAPPSTPSVPNQPAIYPTPLSCEEVQQYVKDVHLQS